MSDELGGVPVTIGSGRYDVPPEVANRIGAAIDLQVIRLRGLWPGRKDTEYLHAAKNMLKAYLEQVP